MSEEVSQIESAEPAQVEATTPEAALTATPATNEPANEFGYVPPKFLKADGSPDFEKLAKSYTALEKGFSKKPNLPAATVDEYDFKFGEGFEVDEERTNAFKTEALAKGVTKDQYAWLMETYAKQMQSLSEQSGAWSSDKAQATLQAEWGGDYDHNVKTAAKAFEAFAPSDATLGDPVWNHPAVMKMLARMGTELGEDSVTSTKGVTAGGSMTKSEIEAIQFSPGYWDDPAKQRLVTEWYEKNIK